jgi:hypothetical protein
MDKLYDLLVSLNISKGKKYFFYSVAILLFFAVLISYLGAFSPEMLNDLIVIKNKLFQHEDFIVYWTLACIFMVIILEEKRCCFVIMAIAVSLFIFPLPKFHVKLIEIIKDEPARETVRQFLQYFLIPCSLTSILIALVIYFQQKIRSQWPSIQKNAYKNIQDKITALLKNYKQRKDFEFPFEVDPYQSDWQTHLQIGLDITKIKSNNNTDGKEPSEKKVLCTPLQIEYYNKIHKKVHYEITIYPKEICYGVHMEMEDFEQNDFIMKHILPILRSANFLPSENSCLVKKPHWIFLIRSVSLQGNYVADWPEIDTHGQHFAELVLHTFKRIYDYDYDDDDKTFIKNFMGTFK